MCTHTCVCLAVTQRGAGSLVLECPGSRVWLGIFLIFHVVYSPCHVLAPRGSLLERPCPSPCVAGPADLPAAAPALAARCLVPQAQSFLTSLLRCPGLLDVIFYLNRAIFPKTYFRSCIPPPKCPRQEYVGMKPTSATILPAGLGLRGLPGLGLAVRLSPRPEPPAS